MGIPCSLLVFISLATSKRGLHGHDIFGDQSLDCVVRSSLHLSRACLLALLCMARNVFWAAEQPSTSKLPQIPYYRALLSDPLLETFFTRLSGPQNLQVMISCYLLIRKKDLIDILRNTTESVAQVGWGPGSTFRASHPCCSELGTHLSHEHWVQIHIPNSLCSLNLNIYIYLYIYTHTYIYTYVYHIYTCPFLAKCWFLRPAIPFFKKKLTKQRREAIRKFQKRKGLRIVRKSKNGSVLLGAFEQYIYPSSSSCNDCIVVALKSGIHLKNWGQEHEIWKQLEPIRWLSPGMSFPVKRIWWLDPQTHYCRYWSCGVFWWAVSVKPFRFLADVYMYIITSSDMFRSLASQGEQFQAPYSSTSLQQGRQPPIIP